jgi:hypothetical protein
MLDPIVRAAAHPSRAILDARARRCRLSETGNVTANGSSSIRRPKCDIAEIKHAIQLAVTILKPLPAGTLGVEQVG